MSKNTQITTNINTGLTTQQVNQLVKEGKINRDKNSQTESVKDIIFHNVFTFFNLINFILAGLIIYVHSYRNLLFLIVIFSNIIIGSYQEIKSKRILDRLSLLASKDTTVLRNSKEEKIPENDVVLGDILILYSGEQVAADARIVEGAFEVDQSLLTGESTPVLKEKGDSIIAGSIIIGGEGKAVVTEVGSDSFTGKLTAEAKKFNGTQSEIQTTVNTLIKVIAFALVPIGIILYLKDTFLLHINFTETIVSTVAALIAMIPQGLVLLVSLVFALAVIALAHDHVLVQKMSSVPTLSRINMLCLDKTGTITEGKLDLIDIVPLNDFTKNETIQILNNSSQALDDHDQVIRGILEYLKKFPNKEKPKVIKSVPFSSLNKYSGMEYEVNGKLTSVIIGSPSFVLGQKGLATISEKLNYYTKQGDYVILLATSDKPFNKEGLPDDTKATALLIYRDKLRPSVPDALKFFLDQGIPIKIVSGDNPVTASATAKRAGLPDYFEASNAADLKTYEDVKKAVKDTAVFGNCLPIQKKQVVEALEEEGYIVGYFGNGDNDILALKEADISGAVADGAQAACIVSDLVLLNSSFAPLPKIVLEGRKLINNLTRSSILYLSKTIFAILIVVLYLFLSRTYPFEPIQYTLVSAVTIGIPSFILAIQANKELVHGTFLNNVEYKAVPAGIMMFIGVACATFLPMLFGLSIHSAIVSTLCVYALAIAGFILVISLCRPFDLYRTLLSIGVIVLFLVAVIFFGRFFLLESLNFTDLIIIGIVVLIELVSFWIFTRPKVASFLTKYSTKLVNRLKRITLRKKKEI